MALKRSMTPEYHKTIALWLALWFALWLAFLAGARFGQLREDYLEPTVAELQAALASPAVQNDPTAVAEIKKRLEQYTAIAKERRVKAENSLQGSQILGLLAGKDVSKEQAEIESLRRQEDRVNAVRSAAEYLSLSPEGKERAQRFLRIFGVQPGARP